MPSPLSPRRAAVELFGCSLIWGFSFVATRWALAGMGPLWVTAARFVTAWIAALPLLLFPRLRRSLQREQWRLSFLPGLLVSGTLLLQAAGLQTTTVTRSGFITCLYVVFVPIMESLSLRRRLPLLHWGWVGLSLVGAALICRLEAGEWNRGDSLTLLSAFLAACQILALEIIATRITSAFAFNLGQAFWAGVLPLVAALIWEGGLRYPLPAISLGGVFCLAVPSTLLAFMVQVRSQRVLPPSVVSMLFLLESPCAALFGHLLFHETMTAGQWLGAALILVSATGTLRVTASKAYS